MRSRQSIFILGFLLSSSFTSACSRTAMESSSACPEVPATAKKNSANQKAENQSSMVAVSPPDKPAPNDPGKIQTKQARYPVPTPEPSPHEMLTPLQPTQSADAKIRETPREEPKPFLAKAEPIRETVVPAKTSHSDSAEVIPASKINSDADPVPRPVETKANPETPLLKAFRLYVDKHPDEAIKQLKNYDKLNQEVLLWLLPLAARLTENSLEVASPKELAAILEEIDTLETRLRPRSELTIDKMYFCNKIKAFGVFEPLPDNKEFRPGDQVDIYVEVRNFSSEERAEQSGKTYFVTHLASSWTISDYAGHPCQSQEFVLTKPDISRSLRHDYFYACSFRVPDIKPGSYTLWINIEDVPTHRRAKHSLDFNVTAVPVNVTTATAPGS